MQGELFDAGLRRRRCLKCRRRLHPDAKQIYRTRVAGLCYVCLAQYEQWRGWSMERFIQETRAELPISDSCASTKVTTDGESATA